MSSQRLITKEGMEAQYKHCMSVRKHKASETAITFKHDACDFGMLNQAEMTEEMRRWRQLRKEGKLKIEEYNNKLRVIEGINSTLNGKKWYVLTIQPIKDDVSIDPFGLMVLGYMVSGYIYAFDKEENRDAVYKYVMGIKEASGGEDTSKKCCFKKRCVGDTKTYRYTGNNANPVMDAVCCDDCNAMYVIPARLANL